MIIVWFHVLCNFRAYLKTTFRSAMMILLTLVILISNNVINSNIFKNVSSAAAVS